MILIGISGKAKSGKDEVCKHLMSKFPSSERIAFADACKDEVCSALRITREELERHKDLYRPLLQWWGTEYRRKTKGENYWIEKWLDKALKSTAEGLIVAPDVRFINEAQTIHDSGGYVWRINRPTISQDTHISEVEMDSYTKFDCEINNDRMLIHLYQEVNLALQMEGLLKTK